MTFENFVIVLITSIIKSSLNCWLLITMQCIEAAVQNKLNILYIFNGIKNVRTYYINSFWSIHLSVHSVENEASGN